MQVIEDGLKLGRHFLGVVFYVRGNGYGSDLSKNFGERIMLLASSICSMGPWMVSVTF